jgi:hypothetical protein
LQERREFHFMSGTSLVGVPLTMREIMYLCNSRKYCLAHLVAQYFYLRIAG